MKFLYLFILAYVALFSACNPIEPQDRLLELPLTKAQRNVLVEEFTGQQCVNCPDMAKEVHLFQNTYSENQVIVVGIHATALALENNAKVKGLKTRLGDIYFKPLGVAGIPNVRVNRSGKALGLGLWSSNAIVALNQNAPLALQVDAIFNENTNQVAIKTTMLSDKNGIQGKLQLWLVEDSIIAPQAFKKGRVEMQYIHNHVLRDAINGDWGEEVVLENRKEKKIETTYVLPNGVDPKHAWLVAFVYNNEGVMQVMQTKLIP